MVIKNQTPKFFDPKGGEIDKDEFVKIYSLTYFWSPQNRNNLLEDKIERILKRRQTSKDELTEEEISDILCWKTGGQRQGNNVETARFQKSISISEVKKCIDQHKDNDAELLTNLISIDDVGYVYALTMLYFLSGGEYPIFDRYAHVAITAITDNIGFCEPIKYNDLTTSTNGDYVLRKYDSEYRQKIYSVFSKEETLGRDVDRALWAYGHLFYKEKK